MGTLRQFKPRRLLPLLQQDSFWPLPHWAPLCWPLTSASEVYEVGGEVGAAEAERTAAARTMNLVKDAIVMELIGGVSKVMVVFGGLEC
jgi:hypothetical protein